MWIPERQEELTTFVIDYPQEEEMLKKIEPKRCLPLEFYFPGKNQFPFR